LYLIKGKYEETTGIKLVFVQEKVEEARRRIA
jgi:hypothetical protein